VLTRAIDLNALVGREFTVGGVRADVLTDGDVAVGDSVASAQ
jgi:hypothetical protein